MPLMMESRLGPYRIVARIGAGGMGEVYRAHDEKLGRDLALKVLPPETMAHETARARLIREARTASSLNHPHIAHIYEVGEDQGHIFIAMELIEGESLQKRIQQGNIPAETALTYATQIADALAYAHKRGVIHRDLKSANIMVTPDGWIKVLDFGLAKRVHEPSLDDSNPELNLTAPGLVLGTPNYLPPEVLRGDKADAVSDVWAFGVVLYEMVTGKLPFHGGSVGQLADAILNTAPGPISGRVPVGLRAVIERCLAKEPSARYRDGAEALAALQALQPRVATRAGVVRRFGLPVAASLLVLAAGVAIGTGKLRIPGVPALGGGAGGPGGSPPKINSLAVLPLANLSGDPTQEYFADGMTEELITDLASIKDLKVISRTSAMRYKGSKKSLREIAGELRVDGVIEGSVLRAGDRVRITAQLIQASSDQHLWARSYERDFKDVLSLQSEVARDIAGEIRMQVSPQVTAQRRPVDPVAYDLYLKGRYEWNKVSPEGVKKALEYYQQALARDPKDPRYASGIADAYLLRVQVIGDLSNKEGMAKVKEYAGRALAADDLSAEAHTSMGAALFFFDWNWKEAERHFKRSIDLNPGYSTGRLIYSVLLGALGRQDEAEQQDRVAQELDPMSMIIKYNSVACDAYAGRLDEALTKAKQLVQLYPDALLAQGTLFKVHEMRGEYPEALDVIEKFLPEEQGGKAVVAKIRAGYKASGPRGYWRAVLVEELKGDSPAQAMRLAAVYSRLGDADNAVKYLEKAFAEHSSDLVFLNVEPYYDPVRADPRFQAMVRRVGLTPRV